MKKLIALSLAVASLVSTAFAATPTYTSKSGAGNATTPTSVIFKADPDTQIRLVNINWQSDTNNAVLSYSTGEGAYIITATNLDTSSVTQRVSTTAGLVANSIVVLQKANGLCYPATLSSTNSGTNIVLASGGWGVTVAIDDAVYQMSTASTVLVGATTNAVNGEAIYVGNYGRPVRIQLTPALATNRITTATARYE